MPLLPKKPCLVPCCPNVRPCPKHEELRKPFASAPRRKTDEKGYTYGWKKIRRAFLEEHPWCVVCGLPATEVDHVVPLSQGGTRDDSNLRSYCKPDHAAKTAADIRRRQRR